FDVSPSHETYRPPATGAAGAETGPVLVRRPRHRRRGGGPTERRERGRARPRRPAVGLRRAADGTDRSNRHPARDPDATTRPHPRAPPPAAGGAGRPPPARPAAPPRPPPRTPGPTTPPPAPPVAPPAVTAAPAQTAERAKTPEQLKAEQAAAKKVAEAQEAA